MAEPPERPAHRASVPTTASEMEAAEMTESGPFIHEDMWIYPIRKVGGKTKLFTQRRALEVDTVRAFLRNAERESGKIKWEVPICQITFLRRDQQDNNSVTFDSDKKDYSVSFKDNSARDSFCLLIETIKSGESVDSLKKPTMSSAKFRRRSTIALARRETTATSNPLLERAQPTTGGVGQRSASFVQVRNTPVLGAAGSGIAANALSPRQCRAEAVTQFKVEKLRGGKRGRGHQKRVLEVDLTVACIRNMNETGRCKWQRTQNQLYIKDLLGYRKAKGNSCKGVVEAVKKKYALIFESESHRDQFIELLDLAKLVLSETESYNFELAPTETISIAVCSWNLGNSLPPTDLSEWIRPGHDLYAIGVQEAYYKLGDSSEEDTCRKDWIDKLEAHFPLQEYAMVARAFLWEMTLCVYARRKHLGKISNVKKGSEATGLAHVLGNKGGLGITMQFMETSLCFISSHLAAFQEGVDNRNSNYREIVDGLKLDADGADLTERNQVVIWFGDLNYRIDLPRDRVIALIAQRDWSKLADADQLIVQQAKQAVFDGFTDGLLSFPPTYRYLRNVYPRVYDDEKARIPAWCDRVLWKTWPGINLTQSLFESVDSITTSDHSPVLALFQAEILRAPRSTDGRRAAMLPSRYQLQLQQFSLHLQKYSSEDISPYCKFTASFLSTPFQTSCRSKTLDPRWDTEDVSCVVMVSSKEYLKRQYLFVFVVNSNEKPIGFSVIPIGPSMPPQKGTLCSAPIRKGGLEVGRMEYSLDVSLL